MRSKLIIFDLDGTLLDTLDDLADAVNEALTRSGFPAHPTESYKQMVGLGARHLMKQAAFGDHPGPLDPMALDRLLAAFGQAYEQRWNVKTRPYPGICDLMDRLAPESVTLAILSNKPDAFTRKIARHYFPEDLFPIVHGLSPDYPAKPDPALTQAIMRQADATLDRTALIGDSGSDMRTAVAAGILPIGVLWGFRQADELIQNGARILAKTPADLGDSLIEWIRP